MGKKPSIAQQANVNKARARRFAMQAVYQHLLTSDSFSVIAEQVKQRATGTHYDHFFFDDILDGINEFIIDFNRQIAPLLDRPLKQLDPVEHAIIMVATYELNSGKTPPKVAINEGIILAKKFAGPDSHKFINGVLDKLYQDLLKSV